MTDLYLATINTPGHLPQDDERHVFTSPRDAWAHLIGEREAALRDLEDYGPDYDHTLTRMSSCLGGPRDRVGTVYGPTPGYEGDHDQEVAYSVTEWAHARYPHEHGRLYQCGPCEYTCHCTGDPGHTVCVHCGMVAEEESTCESDICEAVGHG